jgi:DNA-binding XRE family transcriptional regulator
MIKKTGNISRTAETMDGAMINKRENFPELLKDVRRQLGISQEELVHELGVSFATLNHWENAKTSPSMLVYRQFDAFCKSQPIDSNAGAGGKQS